MNTKDESFLLASIEKERYMLLDRMRSDCEYFINMCGCSRSAIKFLWAQDPVEQIQYMKFLWQRVPEKPEWLTMEKICEYERIMTGCEG